jgi:hypothetical protein
MSNQPASNAAKGGLIRAAKLTPEQRSEIARKASDARWGQDLPRATHDGPLPIADRVLLAAVLPNGKRLLSQGTFLQALGRSRTPKAGTGGFSTVDGLPFFLQAELLKPFISEELLLSTTPIFFRLKSGQRAIGYDALLLPLVCEVYLKLRDSILADPDPKKREIPKKYDHIVKSSDALMRGLAKQGIIAMVDQATGYQADKAKEDLLKLIEAYISPHLLGWTRKFPHEFFKEVYRLHNWEYKAGCTKHPQYLGKFILKYVYDALPPEVLEELKQRLPKNENGNRRAKLWQLLTVDTGIPHLDRQITATHTLMQISGNKDDFKQYYDRAFGVQTYLPLNAPMKQISK